LEEKPQDDGFCLGVGRKTSRMTGFVGVGTKTSGMTGFAGVGTKTSG
jgi:hypothetical protein